MSKILETVVTDVVQLTGSYLPSLIGAIIILMLGWTVALLVATSMRRLVMKTGLSERLEKIGVTDAKALKVEEWTGRLVFWLIMLFVLIAFFQALGLTLIIDPLNNFVTLVIGYLPNLVAAVVILFAAWIFAVVFRFILVKVLGAVKLDAKLEELTGRPETRIPITQTIAGVAYWLTLLLFLPAVVGALKLTGLLRPMEGMIDKVIGFLPNIFVAVIIILAGWLFARIIQRVVSNLLSLLGIDSFSERIGFAPVLGKQKLSSILGLLVYILILIPVFIAALDSVHLTVITEPASDMLRIILAALPSIFGAFVLMSVAYFIGRWLTELITNLLAGAGFDHMLVKFGISRKLIRGRWSSSAVVGTIILITIMILASIEALKLIHLTVLADLLSRFVVLVGNVILGLIIFAVGYYLARLAARAISTTGRSQAGFFATISRIAIIFLAAAMGLSQMGLANQIITIAFGLILGAVAVAAAIAFGIGGKDMAARKIRQWMESIESEEESEE